MYTLYSVWQNTNLIDGRDGYMERVKSLGYFVTEDEAYAEADQLPGMMGSLPSGETWKDKPYNFQVEVRSQEYSQKEFDDLFYEEQLMKEHYLYHVERISKMMTKLMSYQKSILEAQ